MRFHQSRFLDVLWKCLCCFSIAAILVIPLIPKDHVLLFVAGLVLLWPIVFGITVLYNKLTSGVFLPGVPK